MLCRALAVLVASLAIHLVPVPSARAQGAPPPARNPWVMPGAPAPTQPAHPQAAPTQPAPDPASSPPAYPQPAYPQPAYPQAAYPQPAYPQPAYPQAVYPQPAPPPGAAVSGQGAGHSAAGHPAPNYSYSNSGNSYTVVMSRPQAPGAWSHQGAPPGYAAPGTAAAESREPAPRRPREFHLDLGVGTEFPISVGGVLTAELPHRFLLQLGAGVMPRAYADTIDGFLTSVGAYDAVISQAVRASLSDAFVLRASLGGRPFSAHGFEILAGYTLIKGGGSLSTAGALDAILAETGYPLQAPESLPADIPIGATLHNIHASIGWRWLVADDRLVLRASLSYFQTVASQVTVDIPDTATEVVPFEAEINEQVSSYLGPFFSKYAKAPTLGLSAAFRF